MMQRLGPRDRFLLSALLVGIGLVVALNWPADPTAATAASVLAATIVVAIFFVAGGMLLAGVLLRVVLALVPIVALAGSLIWFVLVPNQDIGEARTALIAGTVIATGWVATFLAAEYQRARDRNQTQQDVLVALQSEVFAIIEKLDKDAIAADAERVQERIAAGGDGAGAYYPFSVSESPPIVYQAVSGSISVLDAVTLEPVLRFYAAFSELTAVVADVRSAEFRALSADRRVAVHKGLTQNRIATLTWGLRALVAINMSLGANNPRGIPRSGRNPEITA